MENKQNSISEDLGIAAILDKYPYEYPAENSSVRRHVETPITNPS